MPNKLYVVPGSHPCAATAAALELKGVPYRRVDWLPVVHKLLARAVYGAPTVPGMKLEGEKVVGSRAIMRRLDAMVPEPPLYPADAERRAQVERAEEWGDEVLQPLARRLSWAALKRIPSAAESFTGDAKLILPARMTRPTLPLVTKTAARLNGESDTSTQEDLRDLPSHLDRVDGWVADGVLGGERPNAADLQIGASLGLMLALGDLRPLIEGRPGARLAAYLTPPAGTVPAGVLPPEWLPANPAMSPASTSG
jgi:glutathione S-transferase